MLTLDPETGEHWIADSEQDLGPEAVLHHREPFKPVVVRLHVRWPRTEYQLAGEFRLVYLSTAEARC